MFTSTGTLVSYVEQGQLKLIVEVDPQISVYYRSLIPKYCRVNRQRYAPHISVVRDEEVYEWSDLPELVIFWYSGIIHHDDTYFWLEANSWDLQDLRVKLGLTSTSLITRSPDGEHDFHITLGNTKYGKEVSSYIV